jgi:poly(A)-specific ribonuclease
MDVTRANFEVVLPHIRKLLAEAEFSSIDFEMSGIRTAEDKNDIEGTAADAFPEKSRAAQRYTLVQFGLCIFTRKPAAPDAPPNAPKLYTAHPFNFFVFPGDKSEDIVINVDTAAFLAKHNMDFSKWITEGVPYLKRTKAEEMREKLARKHGSPTAAAEDEDGEAAEEVIPAAKKGKPWDQSFLARLDKLDSAPFTNAMAEAARYAEKVKLAEESNGHLPDPSPELIPAFRHKDSIALFGHFLSSLDLVKTSKRSGKGPLYYMSSAGARDRKELVDLERSIGATRVVEALSAAKKPIVVHNGLMDLLFMHHCFDGEPVTDLGHFKSIIRKRFPLIFDTRFLVTSPKVPFDARMVQNLEGQYNAFHQTLGSNYGIELPLGFEAYDPAVLDNSSRAHEAAYDALITGRLLLYMSQQLGDGTVGSLVEAKLVNKVPVYGCLETIRLAEPTDTIDHDGPVLSFAFPRNAGMSSSRIDEMLRSNDLRGRILWNGDRAFVFSPASSRGTLFDKSVGQALQQLRKNTSNKGTVTVLRP